MSMKIILEGNMKVNAEYGNFIIRTDQSKKDGGDETAPAPYQLFLASIGTCAGAYIIAFCKSRNISYDGIELEQKMVYDTVKRKMGQIKINIKLPPDFPEKYRSSVVKAAESCAVKKTILDPPDFSIDVID
jgi:putative redox protein